MSCGKVTRPIELPDKQSVSPISPMERPYKRTEIGKKVTVEIQGNTVDLWIRDWNGESLATVDRSELLAALDAFDRAQG
jgi:hypothetical protein